LVQDQEVVCEPDEAREDGDGPEVWDRPRDLFDFYDQRQTIEAFLFKASKDIFGIAICCPRAVLDAGCRPPSSSNVILS
jgi:hypothetical protein